jgi:hypothetical protein
MTKPVEKEMMDRLTESKWFKSRPKSVQKSIKKYPPFYLYEQKQTGYKVRIYSYSESEDGRCTKCQILVLIQDNPTPDLRFKYPLLEDRRVFGIKLKDLIKLRILEEGEF